MTGVCSTWDVDDNDDGDHDDTRVDERHHERRSTNEGEWEWG